MKKLSHAGGIVFRPSAAGASFLIVQSRSDPTHWVLPKGHIDPGETAETAAAREVREEAGVDGEIVDVVGDSNFVARRGPGRVRFYLMRERGAVPAIEDRQIAWLPYQKARARLTFADQRELVDLAHRMLGTRTV